MRIAVSIVGLVLLTNCTMPTRVELGNLAPEAIVVTGASGREGPVAIAVHASAELTGLDMPVVVRFSVAIGAEVLRYELSRLPGDDVHTRFTGRTVKAQFGADRCIRLLRKEQDVFDPAPASQPDGFPLCPRG